MVCFECKICSNDAKEGEQLIGTSMTASEQRDPLNGRSRAQHGHRNRCTTASFNRRKKRL
jgi:hypothetical protein